MKIFFSRLHKTLLIVPLVLLSLALCSCSTTDNDLDSDIPWNAPQPWEGSPLIPGMDRM